MAILFNNIPASSVNLIDPRNGKWTAELVIPGPQAPKVGEVGVLQIDSLELTAWVTKSIQVSANVYKLLLEPGTTSATDLDETYLNDVQSASMLINVTGYQILKTIFSQGLGQEYVSPILTDTRLLSRIFKNYQILSNQSTYKQVDLLLQNFPGSVWRHDKITGLVNVIHTDGNTDASMPSQSQLKTASFSGNKTYLCPKLDKYPEPGTKHPKEGWTIEQVQVLKDAKTTTVVLYKNTVNGLLKAITKDKTVLINQTYLCSVVSQNPDGTLNLTSTDERISGDGLISVPYETIPGLTLQVLPGTKCTIAFKEGNPEFPYVFSFGEQTTGFTHVLGTEALANYVALSNRVDEEIQRIWDHLTTTFTPVAQDGGAAIQTASVAAASSAKLQVQSTAAVTLKVE
jgi:hypothetical protein